MVTNIVVVVCYWTLIIDIDRVKYADDVIAMNHVYILHSFPTISAILNFLVTDIVMLYSHVKGMIVFGVFYLAINYLIVMSTGVPLYWFLTWTDFNSFLVAFALIFFGALGYLALVSLTHCVNGGKLK